jgi:hypothetical protein
MAKLKVYWAALRKHHFWVLCGLIFVVGLFVWLKATSDLQARFNDNQKKIKSTFDILGVLGLPDSKVPNEKFIKGLQDEQVALKKQVLDASAELYKKQLDTTKWPAPVENIGKLGPDEPIPQAMRQNYMIAGLKAQWDEMFKKVRIRRPKNPIDPNAPMGADRHIEFEGIVVWDPEARDELVNRYQLASIPFDRRVRVTQEDMWVYQSVVELVDKLNTGATDSLNAVVRKIERVDVAQWAIEDAQKEPGAEIKLKKVEEAAAATSPLGDEGMVKVPGHENATDEKKDEEALLDGRYLDENMQPIKAEAALKSPPFAEFKQMFLNMKFVMDQRKIPELLAACANSPLRIEPRQVLLEFTDIDSPAKQEGAELPNASQTFEHGPYDALVQIRAIAYLYNQPKEDKLGTGSAPKPAQRLLGIPQIEKEKPLLSVPEQQF